MKKGIILNTIALALTAVLSFAACSNGTADASGNAGGAWPPGDVTLVVPAAAGGGTDIFARIAAAYLQKETGKNFTVLNQDAGGGMVAYETVRNSKPDGTTLLFWHTGFYVNNYTGTYDYNPNIDFTPVSMLNSKYSTQVLAVGANAPYNDINDLAEAAKAAPDTITYGCQIGGAAQMVAELLMQETGIEIRLVDAASQTDKITGLIGGNLDVSAISTDAAMQYVEAGDLKVLGLIDRYPDERFPDLTPLAQQGYEDLYYTQNLCLFGPKGLNEDMVREIAELMENMSADEAASKQMLDSKMEMFALSYEESQESFIENDNLAKRIYGE